MKQYVIISIFLMLANLSAICQNVYPRQAVIDNDTVGIISIEQVRTLNKTFVDLDQCQEIKDSLNSKINTYTQLTHTLNSTISSQDKELLLKQNITYSSRIFFRMMIK